MGDLSRIKEIGPSLLEQINKDYKSNRTKDIVPKIHANMPKLTEVELEPIIFNDEEIGDDISCIMFMNSTESNEENISPIIGNQILPKCLQT